MADKSAQLVLTALARAASAPEGLPLHTAKGLAGLFPGSGPARQVAQRCLDDGLLRAANDDKRASLTDAGLAYLLREGSPRRVLEDFLRAVEARQDQLDEVLAVARQTQDSLNGVRHALDQMLQRARGAEAAPAWFGPLLDRLRERRLHGAAGDCPLSELYRFAQATAPGLTIGAFHDGLRRLHDEERIYLHPWTGPLYDLPEPPLALLVGHEVAFYASLR